MSIRRHLIAALTIAASNLAADPVSACCLTDWLFGRTPPVYAAGYAPVSNTPYAANPYTSLYAPPGGVPLVPLATTSRYQISGVYPAQQPSYLNNPSVYTGMPVNAAPVLASPTVQANYRGALPITAPITAPTTSFYNGGSVYPTQPLAPQYSAGYAPTNTAAVTGLPPTAMPATQMTPLYPIAPQRPAGGLARFFGSLFGTNYQTTYYSAPVTYYRPVNTVDPISGTTVTTQQGCSSYVDQIQRTPYASFGSTTPANSLPQNYPTTPVQSPAAYGTFNADSGNGSVGQVSGTMGPSERSVVPIPSTGSYSGTNPFQSQNYNQPNAAPLTGSPAYGQPAYGQQPAPAQPNDSAPLGQPRLESARPALTPPSMSAPTMAPPSWQLQSPADSNVFGSSSSTYDSQNSQPQDYSSVRPIQAPPNYQPPFQRESLNFQPNADDRSSSSMETSPVAPQLPPSFETPASTSQRDQMISHIPVREAALVRERTYRASVSESPTQRQTSPAPSRKPRDSSGWYSLNP